MFKKLNFKTLFIVFGVLLLLVVVLKLVQHNNGDRNFKDRFFEVDTAKISTITIVPHSTKQEFTFVRNGKFWNLVKKDKTYNVEKNAMESVLSELQGMKPSFVASMDKSEWLQYQVNDTSATHVKVEQGGKTVADFFVGKMFFKQYEQTSYVRIADDDNVYAVNGLLAMAFNREANDFRDKMMVRIANTSAIKKLEFSYPDSSFTLTKEGTGWMMNGIMADSAKVASYLGNITYLYASDFVDDSVVSGKDVLSLKIEGDNLQPIELKAFSTSTNARYVITSSMNAEGRFSGVKGDLAKRVFVGLKYFKSTPKKETKGEK